MFQEEEDGSGIIFAEEHSAISHRSRKSSKSFEVSSSDEVFPFKILYIAMEFCSGISLRAFIDERFN